VSASENHNYLQSDINDALNRSIAIHCERPSATSFNKRRVIDFLSLYSRDIGTLTFNGKVERVRELVEADPSLARTTADGDSLLFWLPRDNEARAVAIAQLLLEHGADPSVTDVNGMTPGDRAGRLAMFELATYASATLTSARSPISIPRSSISGSVVGAPGGRTSSSAS
jgi:ankyrin repeat protein